MYTSKLIVISDLADKLQTDDAFTMLFCNILIGWWKFDHTTVLELSIGQNLYLQLCWHHP